jgi:epoxyqueuosine reductase
MVSPSVLEVSDNIIDKAHFFGASLAGVASVADLLASPSHQVDVKVDWSSQAKSVMLLALAHQEAEAELDWWGVEAGTEGNRRLQLIATSLRQYLNKAFQIEAQLAPYQPGVFLKDAAVLSGIGIIGANNLLVTPAFGPRVRLRALLLEVELPPTGAIDFSPCDACDKPCLQACPKQAFASGVYSKHQCQLQMDEDERNRVLVANVGGRDLRLSYVKYCRACELACPVGQDRV